MEESHFPDKVKPKEILGPPTELIGPYGEVIDKPSPWERFIGADGNVLPFCGFFSTLIFVLGFTVAGVLSFDMNSNFGMFILSDDIVQAYFSHFEFLSGRLYFTDEDVPPELIKRRGWAAYGATVFMEMQDTNCPGDDCDLTSKNLVQPKYLEYMRRLESAMWNDGHYQEEVCPVIESWSKPNVTACMAPYSPLSLFLWSDRAINKSRNLIQDGLGYIPFGTFCSSWGSPLDPTAACRAGAWTPIMPDSGAAEPAPFENYTEIFEKFCGTYAGDRYNRDYWSALVGQFFPSFTCENDHVFKYGVPFMRSRVFVGIPVKQAKIETEINANDELVDDLADDWGPDLWDILKEPLNDINDNDDSVTVWVESRVANAAVQEEIQAATMAYVGASLLLVWLYMWFNVESLFIASMGMLQVLLSMFPTVFFWDAFVNQQGVQFLQLTGVFLILGIGADTVFVLNDAYSQAKAEYAGLPGIHPIHMFSVAYRRSMSSMVATTMTTSLAFFFGIFNPIPLIRDFCIFACMLVLFNFFYCVSFGAASLAFQDRFMAGQFCCCCGGPPEPGACCSTGCCFGMTRLAWQSITGPKKSDAEVQEAKAIEVFLAGPAFKFLYKSRYPFVLFWTLVIIGCAVLGFTQVSISDKDLAGFPDDHPESRMNTVFREYFRQPDPERLRVLWGFKHGEPASEWSESEAETPSKIETSEADMNTALRPEGQQAILDLCRSPDERAGELRCEADNCLVMGSPEPCERTHDGDGLWYNVDPLCQAGRYCIMEQVKDYADFNNLPFPMPLDDIRALARSTAFHNYMRDYWQRLRDVGQHWHAMQYKQRTGFVIEAGEAIYMWVTFNATFVGFFLPPEKGDKIMTDWEDYLNSYVGNTKFYHIHCMYLFKLLQDALIQEAITSVGASLAVAFVTLVFVTWNWYLSIIGTFNLIAILVIFLGLWVPLGWELDIFNVIFCIMAVGLSVDYTVHLVHAYNEADVPDRESRVQHALSLMGITVISGALTTLLAAAPLLLTEPVFFNRFGWFIFLCILLSLITAMFSLIPALLVIGPSGTFGDIALFYKLRRMVSKPKPPKKIDIKGRIIAATPANKKNVTVMSQDDKQYRIEKLSDFMTKRAEEAKHKEDIEPQGGQPIRQPIRQPEESPGPVPTTLSV